MKRNSKSLAIISLVIMALGFIGTLLLPKTLLSGILHGGFEAGLVGGLADWFAVTALFRHPLGLPIPHTSLLPKNREKITNGITSMVENNWLSKESILDKARNVLTAQNLIDLLRKGLATDKARDGLATLLLEFIKNSDTEKLSEQLSLEFKDYLQSLNINKIVEELIPQVMENKYEEKGFDLVLIKIKEWVEKEENKNKIGHASLKGLSSLKLDGFMQMALNSIVNMISDEKMGQIISNVLINAVENLQHKDNSLRQDLLSAIQNELNNLSKNPEVIESLESWKMKWIDQFKLTNEISGILKNVKLKLMGRVEDRTAIDLFVMPYLIKNLEQLKSNTDLLNTLDTWLLNSVVDFIDKNHDKIGILVKENLEKLDDQTLTSLIEEKVGKDLQWIRVNGAVCGFLIGIVLSFF